MADFLSYGRAVRPNIDRGVLMNILSEHFGLRMRSMKELNSYDDFNFHVDVTSEGTNMHIRHICPDGYVLKVLNSLDSKNTQVLDAQHEMMARVLKSGTPTPQPVPARDGHLFLTKQLGDGNNSDSLQTYVVRVFNFIPGTTLNSVPLTEGLCYKVGVTAGSVDKTLQDFQHPGFADYHRKWHLDCIDKLEGVLHVLEKNEDRELVQAIFKEFSSRIMDNLKDLQSGVIHGDFNEENVLVGKHSTRDIWNDEYKVAAILDYGDSAVAPYVFEVSIAMAYMSLQGEDISVLSSTGHVLAGYLTKMNLSEEEISLLKLCVCARLVQSFVIGAYSYRMNPCDEYTLKTASKGWPILRQLWNMDTKEVVQTWKDIEHTCHAKVTNH